MSLLQTYLGLGLWTWVSINILHFDLLVKRSAFGMVFSMAMMVVFWPILLSMTMFVHLTEEQVDEQP